MRICIISSYPPEKEGVGKFSKRIADNLGDNRLDVFVLTFNYKETYNGSVKVYQVLGSSPISMKRTYRILKKLKPDVLHIQYAIPIYGIYGLFLWLILRNYKKKHKTSILSTFHEVKKEIYFLRKIGESYYSFIGKISDHIIVHTEEARDILVGRVGIDPTKISKIPLGLYSKNANSGHKEHLKKINNIPITNKKIILFFGYIHVDKGIEDLIAAIRQLFIEHPEVKDKYVLLIAGDVRPRRIFFKVFEYIDRKYKKKLKKMIKDFGLKENIIFLGHIKDEDVYPLMEQSTTIVLPYKKAEQSGVLNLALNVNKPVIASAVGGLKELLSSTGLTIKPGDPKGLKDKLYYVLEDSLNKDIPDIYKKIKEENSLNKILEIHKGIYKQLTGML